jgi:hypothetical protein
MNGSVIIFYSSHGLPADKLTHDEQQPEEQQTGLMRVGEHPRKSVSQPIPTLTFLHVCKRMSGLIERMA